MPKSSSDEMRRLCFLIGPIGGEGTSIRKLADWVLDGLVKPVLEAKPFSYEVLRADSIDQPGEITSQVIERIIESELVVADLTGLNPNVMYELAIRHMVSKPVIQLCDIETSLPFDVHNARTIKFDISDYAKVNDTKDLIKRHALGIEEEGFVVSNPVTAANKIADMTTSSDSTERMVAALYEAVTNMKQKIATLEQRPTHYASLDEVLLSRPRGLLNMEDVEDLSKKLTLGELIVGPSPPKNRLSGGGLGLNNLADSGLGLTTPGADSGLGLTTPGADSGLGLTTPGEDPVVETSPAPGKKKGPDSS